ncbi:MAG TPA: hypothetical protein VIU12_26510 [Chryseolinea sp.]
MSVLAGAMVILVGCLLLGWWVVRFYEAAHRTVEIEISPGKTLICQETYTHGPSIGERYFVIFSLAVGDKDTTKLGDGDFSNAKWDTTLVLSEIGDWIVLPVRVNDYAKILLTNIRTGLKKDTVFSPKDLPRDSLWRTKYGEFSGWHFWAQSHVKSIHSNRFSVNYKYRIPPDNSGPIYSQTCIYELDSLTGKFVTKEVEDRKLE